VLLRRSTRRPAAGLRREMVERAKRVAGLFSSNASDVSAHHDRYFAGAFDT
jgi:hypothetical protein